MLTAENRESAKTKTEGAPGRTKPNVETVKRVRVNPLWYQLATGVQARLTMHVPNDSYEREADRIADQVMRRPEPGSQRQCAACTESASSGRRTLTGQLQYKGGEGASTSPEDLHKTAAAGAGQATITYPHRDMIERSFGAPVTASAHVDPSACSTLNAQAYTYGGDVLFPTATPSLYTAAHEAAHVVQQAQGVRLKDGIGSGGDEHERQADAAADLVVAGRPAGHLFGATAGGSPVQTKMLQLQPGPSAAVPHPYRAILDKFIARYDTLRAQLDTKNTTTFKILTTMVGMYTNDVFKQWERWRKDAMKISDDAFALMHEIDKSIIDNKLDVSKPDEKALEDEAILRSSRTQFLGIDAQRTLLPKTTEVTVIERVYDVVFTTVANYKMTLQDWLDQVKADYEVAWKKKAAGASASTGTPPTPGAPAPPTPSP